MIFVRSEQCDTDLFAITLPSEAVTYVCYIGEFRVRIYDETSRLSLIIFDSVLPYLILPERFHPGSVPAASLEVPVLKPSCAFKDIVMVGIYRTKCFTEDGTTILPALFLDDVGSVKKAFFKNRNLC